MKRISPSVRLQRILFSVLSVAALAIGLTRIAGCLDPLSAHAIQVTAIQGGLPCVDDGPDPLPIDPYDYPDRYPAPDAGAC